MNSRVQKRDHEIDFLKGIAILFVVLTHSIPKGSRDVALGCLYIGQAVPMFMILSGFNSRLSWEHKRLSLKDSYGIGLLRNKTLRLLVPLGYIVLVQAFFLWFVRDVPFVVVGRQFIKQGGWGPGSYFPWLFIQCLLILPLLNSYMQRAGDKYRKTLIVLLACIMAESLCSAISIPSWVYRLLCVRYVFALYVGIAWAKNELAGRTVVLLCSVGGALYILLDRYLNHIFAPVIYPAWESHHAFAYPYTLVFMMVLKLLYGTVRKKIGFLCGAVTSLGVASYHIFLVQMLYFWVHDLGAFQGFYSSSPRRITFVIFSCAATTVGGCAFYVVERHLSANLFNAASYMNGRRFIDFLWLYNK